MYRYPVLMLLSLSPAPCAGLLVPPGGVSTGHAPDRRACGTVPAETPDGM
jgi:hypothetical protein